MEGAGGSEPLFLFEERGVEDSAAPLVADAEVEIPVALPLPVFFDEGEEEQVECAARLPLGRRRDILCVYHLRGDEEHGACHGLPRGVGDGVAQDVVGTCRLQALHLLEGVDGRDAVRGEEVGGEYGPEGVEGCVVEDGVAVAAQAVGVVAAAAADMRADGEGVEVDGGGEAARLFSRTETPEPVGVVVGGQEIRCAAPACSGERRSRCREGGRR